MNIQGPSQTFRTFQIFSLKTMEYGQRDPADDAPHMISCMNKDP